MGVNINALDASRSNKEQMTIRPTFESLTDSNLIKDEMTNAKKKLGESPRVTDLFLSKPANDWLEEAKHLPSPKFLFSEFWAEGELCIMFADSNVGKSILAVQIGDSISKGISIDGFELKAEKQPVLYFDFELTPKQFEVRYSEVDEKGSSCNHYNFNDEFHRIEINPDIEMPEKVSFEDLMFSSLEKRIEVSGARVVIVDNLTYLKGEMEKAKDVIPLLKKLKELKVKHGLSMLVLAHTPKRDLTKEITANDLGGSKHLMNFTDSSFALGESPNEKNVRYIKQIKARNTERKYGAQNVVTCHLEKPSNFLQFKFVSYDEEWKHLKVKSKIDWEAEKDKILELKEKGQTNVEIGKLYGVTEGAIRKHLGKWSITTL